MTRLTKAISACGLAALVLLDRWYAMRAANLDGKDFRSQLVADDPVVSIVNGALTAIELYLTQHEKTFMVLATVAVAYFTWTLYRTAKEQLTATQIALEISERSAKASEATLIGTQRPWVSVDVGTKGPLVITDTGEIRLDMVFNMKNVGKSPALNVQVEPKLVSFMNREGNPLHKLRDLCQQTRQKPLADQSILGHTIFPEENLLLSNGLVITVDEVKKSSWIGYDHEGFAIDLIGCVSYRTAFDDGIHLTQFMGQLRKHNPERPGMHICFRFGEKRLEQSQYALWMSPFIGGRAD